MRAIIDTNVLIAANGRDCPQVTPQCRLKSSQYLRDLQIKGTIVIDNQWLILNEYKHKVNQTGQPGIGDAFLKWILQNLANLKRCEQVTITPLENGSFKEFPNDPELEKFDRSDHKFVAVALAASDPTPIVNAVDSDWVEFYQPLLNNDVEIQFLCPDVIAPEAIT